MCDIYMTLELDPYLGLEAFLDKPILALLGEKYHCHITPLSKVVNSLILKTMHYYIAIAHHSCNVK